MWICQRLSDPGESRRQIPEIRDRGSTLVGAWIVDAGDQLNQVVTLWQMTGLRDRFSLARQTRETAVNWRSKQLKAMSTHESSSILRLLRDWQLNFPQTNGTYELQMTRFRPDSGWQRSFSELTHVKQNALSEHTGTALGIFLPLFGRLNIAYQLWQFKDLDSRNRGMEKLDTNSGYTSNLRSILPLQLEQKRLLLRPTKCSPMQ